MDSTFDTVKIDSLLVIRDAGYFTHLESRKHLAFSKSMLVVLKMMLFANSILLQLSINTRREFFIKLGVPVFMFSKTFFKRIIVDGVSSTERINSKQVCV